MTLEAVRAAALAADPYTKMDDLVRAELSAGRSVRQITKAYLPILDAALETPGLTEDGEEALRGTLDALTGDCHKDCQYREPPNPHLPSEEEIVELARWARVAFAARCARRVLPLYSVEWPDTKPAHYQVVLDAVEWAEQMAETRDSHEARRVAMGVSEAAMPTRTAAGAAGAAANACYAADDGEDSVLQTGKAMRVAFNANLGPNRHIVGVHIRRDFDHLAHLAEVRRWTDDTPVPPDVFGPLWPEGAPKGWPANTDAPARDELVIEAFVGDAATEKKIEDDLVNLFNALNRYHIARSGTRLTLEQFRSLVSAHVLVEV